MHRQRIISNKSLLQNAIRTGLPQYIQGKAFSYRSWQPPGFNVISNAPCNYEHVGNMDPSGGDILAPSIDDVEVGFEPGRKILDTNNSQASSSANKIDALLVEKSANPEKSRSKKYLKKRRQSDEQNTQWLGDKVFQNVSNYATVH